MSLPLSTAARHVLYMASEHRRLHAPQLHELQATQRQGECSGHWISQHHQIHYLGFWVTTDSLLSACCQRDAFHAADADLYRVAYGVAEWKADPDITPSVFPAAALALGKPEDLPATKPQVSSPALAGPTTLAAAAPLIRAPPTASRVTAPSTTPSR